MGRWSFDIHLVINLPNGVDIKSLIIDLREISWKASEILLCYSQILKDPHNKSNIIENDNINDPVTLADLNVNKLIIKEEEIKFIITDFNNELNISFSGTVPNLFSEEKGVVAEGKLQDKTFFIADRILAKHDENYMPPELKDMMKKNAK